MNNKTRIYRDQNRYLLSIRLDFLLDSGLQLKLLSIGPREEIPHQIDERNPITKEVKTGERHIEILEITNIVRLPMGVTVGSQTMFAIKERSGFRFSV
ncbi:MAG: hypothetical protein GXP09_06880 [Gammaproteobacteria bacterium]|nr:hypothetical protein [Gammaproteobacteria bacterium]